MSGVFAIANKNILTRFLRRYRKGY